MSNALKSLAFCALLVAASGCTDAPTPSAQPDLAPTSSPGSSPASTADLGPASAPGSAPASAPDEMAASPAAQGLSLYQLDSPWTTQDGAAFRLDALRGHPAVLLMFYGTCQHACPILINDLKRVDAALDPEVRARTRMVLITIDPERDTPAALLELARSHEIDTSRWTFLHGEDGQIRELAAALGVRYRQTSDGEFKHSNVLTVLDPAGAVSHQTEGLGQPVDGVVKALQ